MCNNVFVDEQCLEIQLGLDVIEQNYDYPNFVFERVFSNSANR